MSDYLNSHFTPDSKLISYGKLLKFTNHQINLIKNEMEKIENDALYYALQDTETLKNYKHYQTALEQWEFLLECLEYRHELLTF